MEISNEFKFNKSFENNKLDYVKIEKFLDYDSINKIRNVIVNFIKNENIYNKLNSKIDFIKDENYFINNEKKIISNVYSFNDKLIPTISNRYNKSGIDDGIIDIFKPFTLLPILNNYINIKLIELLVTKLYKKKYEIFSCKILIQNNVINPTKFLKKKYGNNIIKFNIFLNDIQNLKDGPYVLIKNSDKDDYKINENDIEIIYGNIGDVLIYNTSIFRKRLKQYNKKCNIYISFLLKEM